MSDSNLLNLSNYGITINGVTFTKVAVTDLVERGYICENCERMGLRKTISVSGDFHGAHWLHHNEELRRLFEEHSRQHQNPIVQALADSLNVEKYELQSVDGVTEINMTRLVAKKSVPVPEKKSKRKARRMIQI